MYFKNINEKNSISFVDDLLWYYSNINDGNIYAILTSKDFESQRNNTGWYQFADNQHKLFINVPIYYT